MGSNIENKNNNPLIDVPLTPERDDKQHKRRPRIIMSCVEPTQEDLEKIMASENGVLYVKPATRTVTTGKAALKKLWQHKR